MKKLFIIFGIVISTVACRKDSTPTFCDNCESQINTYSSAYFLKDAEALTYKMISQASTHLGYDKVGLDPSTVNCYLGKLSAIYNACHNSTGSFNQMLNKWAVHVGPHIIMNGFSIKFTDTLGLKLEFITNPGKTSNVFLNELYNDYGFKSISETWYPDQVYVSSMKNNNVRYIKDRLLESSEIEAVYLNFNFLDLL